MVYLKFNFGVYLIDSVICQLDLQQHQNFRLGE